VLTWESETTERLTTFLITQIRIASQNFLRPYLLLIVDESKNITVPHICLFSQKHPIIEGIGTEGYAWFLSLRWALSLVT